MPERIHVDGQFMKEARKRKEGKRQSGRRVSGRARRARERWPMGRTELLAGDSCSVSTDFHSWPKKTFAGA